MDLSLLLKDSTIVGLDDGKKAEVSSSGMIAFAVDETNKKVQLHQHGPHSTYGLSLAVENGF